METGIYFAGNKFLKHLRLAAVESEKKEMTIVNFYDKVDDTLLKFAVIIAKTQGRYVFCKHRERNTWEVPGGHREPGEVILDTAKRELYEETGAVLFDIRPVCAYSVVKEGDYAGQESFGMLYYADISSFQAELRSESYGEGVVLIGELEELHSEIEKIMITDKMPEAWTYPEIQPKLLEEARKRGFI